MKKVFKYSVPLSRLEDYVTLVDVPMGGQALSVINQNGNLCIYMLVDDSKATHSVGFIVAGTGHPIEDDVNVGDFIGTVVFLEGSLVFHVFAL